MKRVEVPSYPVSIFIAGGPLKAKMICYAYCNDVGLSVTVTETSFNFKGSWHETGNVQGVIVGLINYPRFPSTPDAIWQHAEALAARLCAGLKQQSYTIQAPDRTVWFSHRREDAHPTADRATAEKALEWGREG